MSHRRHNHRHRSKGPARQRSTLTHNIARIFTVVMVIVAVILAGFGLFWWQGSSIFTLNHDINIVFVSDYSDLNTGNFYLMHISVNDPRLTVVVPKQTEEVVVLGGYGKYQLSKIYPLLEIDKKDERYTRAAFSWAMGVVVDDVVPIKNSGLQAKKDVVTVLRNQLYARGFGAVLNVVEARHAAEQYFFVRSVPEEAVKINTEQSELSQLTKKLYVPFNDDCTISVVNTTSVPRLATRLGSILENSGFMVVKLDDVQPALDHSAVAYDTSNEECGRVAARMQAVFADKLEVVEKPELLQEYRADVVVMVGEDLGKLIE